MRKIASFTFFFIYHESVVISSFIVVLSFLYSINVKMMPIDASQDLITSSQQPLPFRLFSWRRRLALLPASQRQSALEEMLFQLGTRCDVHTTSGTFSAVVRWRSVGIELVNHEGNHDDGGIGSTFDALMLEFGSIHAVSLERYSMNSSPTPSLHRASDIDPSPSASSEDDEGGIRAYFCVEASAESHHLSDLPPTTEMFLIHPLAMRTSADEQRIRQHAAYLDQLDGVAYHAAWEGTSNSEAWASKVEEQLNLNRRAVAQRAEAAVDGANLPAAQSHSPPPHYPPPQDDDETVLLEAQVRELQQVLQTKELLLSELERQLRVASAEQQQQQRPPIIISTSAAHAGRTDSIPLVFDDLETFDSDLALATEGAGESRSAAMQSNTRRPRTAGGVLLHPDAQLADTALATLPDRPSYSPQSDEDVNEHHDERNDNDHCQNRSAAFPGATAESQSSSTHRPATGGGSAAVITSVRFADVLLIGEEPEGSTEAQPVLVPPTTTSYQNYFQPSSRTCAHAEDASAPETVTAAAALHPHPHHLQGVSG
ncbi:membrane-associated protein, putative [Bodo saltans]|uniref:Membrane-associated protein, putative n=1 Tax=Bodo saltans TaxID=75058 RepID=A0A0S4IM55_BODSA|nr:membrane-associated protein, putative [Bodo saltans]|eukprot:CUE72765.1 membrane-associated protein, putative [Bodo saltans]